MALINYKYFPMVLKKKKTYIIFAELASTN